MAPPPIVLLTDFGLSDAYVGTMKGVILTICPDARIVDLSHGVPPQDVAAGARLLAGSYRYFPAGAIFVAVVDPGVGSSRRAIALRTARGTFVAPDNGLLTPIVRDAAVPIPPSGGIAALAAAPVEPNGVTAVADSTRAAGLSGVVLANSASFLPSVSATFHGRDVFAPVAAHLAAGVPLAALGPALRELVVLPDAAPIRRPGEVVGQIAYLDHFGNAITTIPRDDLAGFHGPVIAVGNAEILGLSHHYAERPGLLALVSSDGYLEIAVNGGSAAEMLGLKVGDRVVVREASEAR